MTRSEGDTWDLASSVGATATSVAASRALATRRPDPLIVDPFAEPLVKAVGLGLRATVSPTVRSTLATTRCSAAGRCASRSRCGPASSTTSSPMPGGRCQAGGHPGFGPGHPRLPAGVADGHRGVRDRPAGGHRVQDPGARRLGATPTADRRTVAIDLRDDWPKALRDERFRPAPADRVDRRGTADLSATRRAGPAARQHHRAQRPGSRLATEHMEHKHADRRLGREADRAGAAASAATSTSPSCSTPASATRAGDYLAGARLDDERAHTEMPTPRTDSSCRDDELAALAGDSGYLTAVLS